MNPVLPIVSHSCQNLSVYCVCLYRSMQAYTVQQIVIRCGELNLIPVTD